jgi:hypothetical protein
VDQASGCGVTSANADIIDDEVTAQRA